MHSGPASTRSGPRFYTYKKQVPLNPDETIGYARGKGYYAKPAPKTAKPRSVFSGVGILTAWDPAAAHGLKADWVAVQLDEEGGDYDLIELRKRFARVHSWQARPSLDGVLTARNLHLDGYIGQSENADEYAACMGLGKLPGLPHAMIGNCDRTWWNNADVAAHGWDLILEAYDNKQPGLNTRLDSLGYPVTSLCYGTWNAYKERTGVEEHEATEEQIAAERAKGPWRIPIVDYQRLYPTGDWCVYLAETLTVDDRALLGQKRAA